MSKKKILFHSDFCLLKTGFARNAKLVLSYLYNTGKYDIVQYCCGSVEGALDYKRLPWKSIGTVPADKSQLQKLNQDPRLAKMVSYGSLRIDDVIIEEKPDVYIAVQDIWGVDYSIEKNWFGDINSVIWTTLDSLPILPSAVEAAKKVKNYWIWSDFATRELNKMGHDQVRTMHGPLDDKEFYKLSDEKKLELRAQHRIEEDAFIVGFVFRNQLRKSVPNLIEGYKKFKDKQGIQSNFKLLLHTHFDEGWNIHRLAEEHGVDKNEILTTYVCKNCSNYFVTRYEGQGLNCHKCGSEKSIVTTQPTVGVSEEQLNEVYNLMDVYCHPFTSGGQEIPIQEAKLTELITLVTNYSCGVDMCETEAQSLPLDWFEFREAGTEFIKASTDPESIAKQLETVFKMPTEERLEMGKKAREWIIDNYSISTIGKQIEEFLDNLPEVDPAVFKKIQKKQNPDASVDDSLPDEEWITALYKNILDMDVSLDDEGFKYWKKEMDNGRAKRTAVKKYFKEVARKEVSQKMTLRDVLDNDDEGKRILFVIPESAGDVYLSTSLFESLNIQYPDHNLYVASSPHYLDVLNGNKYIHKIIPYTKEMEDILLMEGKGSHKGLFEIAFLPHVNSQRFFTYQHNGKDKIAFDLALH